LDTTGSRYGTTDGCEHRNNYSVSIKIKEFNYLSNYEFFKEICNSL